MTPRPLKIAYLCDHSPMDPHPYSGGNARIFQALSEYAGDVSILPAGWGLAEPLRRAIQRLPEAVNMRARWRLHLALGRIIAAPVNRALRQGDFDVLFCAYSFQSLAGLRPPAGMVTAFTSDATPTGYKRSEIGQSFGSFFRPARLLDPWILRHERRIFSAQDLLLWPGMWQKQTADGLYGLRDAQSLVVPWGANIADPGPAAPVTLAPGAPVRFLFVGRDWQAKGGPLVLDTIRRLRAGGIDARLAVVGCTPPVPPAGWLEVHPSLDKSDPDQRAIFTGLFRQAHFMFMASFESWGFAFCEASAHGLPSLALKVGGVPVRDGVNGHALPPGAGPDDFAAIIRACLADPPRYQALRESARRESCERLNWDSWGRNVAAILREKRAEKARAGGSGAL